MNKTKILVIPSDRTGVSFFRSTEPHITLEENHSDNFHIDIVYPKDIDFNNLDFFDDYKIVHFHKTIVNYDQMELFLNLLREKGIITVLDIDDYWLPSSHHPAHNLIKKNGIDKKLVSNIRNTDYVMTTTQLFADDISKYNKNVVVIPNAINPSEKQFTPNPETSDRIRIGWLGGSSHLYDLQLLNGLVNKLKSDGLLDKIQFVLCGFDTRGVVKQQGPDGKITERPIDPKESVWAKYEKIFTDNYNSVSEEYKKYLLKYTKEDYEDVSNEPYRRVWTKPVTSYAKNYNLFDISLAPLEDNHFNKMKSQLKLIEAGFHKKALIVQNFGPYTIDGINAYNRGGGYNEDGNCLMVDTSKNHKQWFKYVKELVLNEDLRNKLSTNLNNTVKETYSLDNTAKMRVDFYNKILKK